MTDSDSHVTKITATSSVETGLKRGEAGQGEREKQQNKMWNIKKINLSLSLTLLSWYSFLNRKIILMGKYVINIFLFFVQLPGDIWLTPSFHAGIGFLQAWVSKVYYNIHKTHWEKICSSSVSLTPRNDYNIKESGIICWNKGDSEIQANFSCTLCGWDRTSNVDKSWR